MATFGKLKPLPRVKPPQRPPGVTRKPAMNAPINYFDPAIYNRLPRALRAKISKKIWIAPLPVRKAKKLSYEAFLDQYGNNIMARYIGLDEEAHDELDGFLSDEEDGDDDDDDDDRGAEGSGEMDTDVLGH